MKKIQLFIGVTLSLFILGGCSYNNEEVPSKTEVKDNNGCLISENQKFNQEYSICLSTGDKGINELKAIKIAKENLELNEPTIVLKVEKAKCEGCYTVEIQDNQGIYIVYLANWNVYRSVISPGICEQNGGRVVDAETEINCQEKEISGTSIKGLHRPSICCYPIFKISRSLSS